MIEIEDGRGIPRTERAYPGPADRWLLRTAVGRTARAWALADPQRTA